MQIDIIIHTAISANEQVRRGGVARTSRFHSAVVCPDEISAILVDGNGNLPKIEIDVASDRDIQGDVSARNEAIFAALEAVAATAKNEYGLRPMIRHEDGTSRNPGVTYRFLLPVLLSDEDLRGRANDLLASSEARIETERAMTLAEENHRRQKAEAAAAKRAEEREAREADQQAFSAALRRWLGATDEWSLAVEEGTISDRGVEAELETRMRTLVQDSAAPLQAISAGGDVLGASENISDVALPRRLAKVAAEIKRRLREAVTSAGGELVRWEPELVKCLGDCDEEERTARTVLAEIAVPVPAGYGYAGNTRLHVESRIIFES